MHKNYERILEYVKQKLRVIRNVTGILQQVIDHYINAVLISPKRSKVSLVSTLGNNAHRQFKYFKLALGA